MPGVSPSERSLVASIGAHLSWANTNDRSARTAPARAALEQKFLDAAGGDPVRAAHLRKAHFQRLALKSAQRRRRARELTAVAELAEAELAEAGGPDAAA
jgi:hypothetical protein